MKYFTKEKFCENADSGLKCGDIGFALPIFGSRGLPGWFL